MAIKPLRSRKKRENPSPTNWTKRMSLTGWQIICQIAIAIGVILGALGGLGYWYTEQQLAKQQAIESQKRERIQFRESIYFNQVLGHWVELEKGIYQVGLVAYILNKDANRAYILNQAEFRGTFSIGGPGGSFSMSSFVIPNVNGKITGQYFLSPGEETKIRLLLPAKMEMEIHQGIPGLNLQGTWKFKVENEEFSLSPNITRMVDVTTLSEWEK